MSLAMFLTNIIRKLRRNKVVFTLFVLFSTLVILNTNLSPDLYFINFNKENVSCHYITTGDALEVIDANFNPRNSIFFHETSCHGFLNSRQACSVESAARAHPDREIYVIFSAPVNKIAFEEVTFALLKKFPNINFKRIHIVDYAKETPIEDLIASGALNRTRFPISHSSDVLRFLSLYKWGGLYLDLDVLVAKSFDGLPKSFAGRESSDTIGSSVLAFGADDVGQMVAYAALSEMSTSFRGDVWAHNGPALITRVLEKLCSTNDVSIMSADICKGFQVFDPILFYPIAYQDSEKYFEGGGSPSANTYAYHVWNRLSAGSNIEPTSLYAKLAKAHCPVVYETFGRVFGT